jgi:tetratricopeptide (TPR) repeat protein
MKTRGQCLAWLMAVCLAVSASAMTAGDRQSEFRAAIQLARDGDLQADWDKMLDARARFAAFADDQDLAALAHYYLGYTDWRLSSLAFVAVGQVAQARLIERAMASLEVAIQKRPAFPDAHALLAACAGIRVAAKPDLGEQLLPRARAAWQAALPAGAGNPRVVLLRAIGLTFAPPPYGDRQKGLEMWREAITLFEKDRPEPLMPDWGFAEAVAWLGGAHLMLDQPEEARVFLERALALRPDFWWAGKAALPIARRPVTAK